MVILLGETAPYEMAIPVLKRALKDDPYSADLLLALVKAHVRAKNHDEATQEFIRLKALVPHAKLFE